MKKQTKLVAVLSTASLLAIGASMTSFAATGWVEENGTWVYYDRDEQRVTDQWARSGNGWYYLDENGEMATDRLIEDDGKYYYVDTNGVMVTNQWVAIENEDAGEDDEPDHYWYYFQANGRAMTNGNNDRVALKTINGKKYAFDDEGRMLYGWVKEDEPERRSNVDGDAFEDGDYYFGGPDDGAMTVGWLQIDITYDDATEPDYKWTAPVFNEDEDQTRWFYFLSNGKKVKADAEDGEYQKERTINGRRYAFDQFGAMIAEWSLDEDEAMASGSGIDLSNPGGVDSAYLASGSSATDSVAMGNARTEHAQYTHQWRYFSDVEDGARISRGWFKVVAAEYLNEDRYNDDLEDWYYADGSGKLYAGEFKTINGRRFAFKNDGRCVFGLNFIKEDDGTNQDSLDVRASDDSALPFEDEDEFDESAPQYEALGYKAYYFGAEGDAPTDGAMRTGRQTVSLGGDDFTFYFETSGGKKGEGVTGKEDDRYYQSGKLLAAGSDERYQVVQRKPLVDANGAIVDKDNDGKPDGYHYVLLEDVEAFRDAVADTMPTGNVAGNVYRDYSGDVSTIAKTNEDADIEDSIAVFKDVDNLNKDAGDVDELYFFGTKNRDGDVNAGLDTDEFFLVNASGRVVDSKSRSRDGSDYYYVTGKKGQIMAVYLEN